MAPRLQIPRFKLNNGLSIPALQLGTWQSPPGQVKAAVRHALANGYDAEDGAWAYRNEDEVGQGVKESGRAREDIFLTSKLWSTFHSRVKEGLDDTLSALATPYLDLYIIHWPFALNPKGNDPVMPRLPDGSRDREVGRTIEQTWKDMEALLETGKVKSIGVSNCNIATLERILKVAKVVPAVNQVENHPYLPQVELVEFCQSKGIVVQAYSPLGSTNGPLMSDELVIELSKKYDTTPASILLSFPVARDIVVLAKSVTPSRIDANLLLVDLEKADVDKLIELGKTKSHRYVDPDWGEDWH